MPSVAVVGASRNREKYGNKSVRAHVAQGFEVYPVNPEAGEVEGLTAWATLDDLPVEAVDRVTMYVPPEVGIELLEAISRKQPGEFFLNPGSESDRLISRAEELGLEPIVACSIVAIGVSPAQFDD